MLKNLLYCFLTLFVLNTSAQRYEWTRSIGNDPTNRFNQKTILQDGKYIYVINEFYDRINFGTTTLIAKKYNPAIYIAKYDTLNNLIWAKKGGAYNSGTYLVGAELGPNGNIYIYGRYYGDSCRWGNKSLVIQGQSDAGYLVKLDSTGSTKWIKGVYFSSTAGLSPHKLTNISFGENNVYISGLVYNGSSIFFSGSNVRIDSPPTINNNYWVATFDSSGNIVSAKNIINYAGSKQRENLSNPILEAINDSAFYICASVNDTFDFGSNQTVEGYLQFCVAKFNSLTNCAWTVMSNQGNSIGSFSSISAIEIADDEGIYFSGAQRHYDVIIQADTVSVSTGFVPNTNRYWTFIGKLSSAGQLQQLKNYDTGGYIFSMAKNSNQELLIVGSFRDSIDLNGQKRYSYGRDDMLFLNLDSNLSLNWYQTGGGNEIDRAVAVTSNASTSFYFNGFYKNISLFGSTSYQASNSTTLIGKMTDCENPIIPFTFSGDTILCNGGSVRVAADILPPASFEWYKDSTLMIGEVFRDVTINNSGNYHTLINRQGCNDTSRTINVSVGTLQSVSLSLSDTVCSQASPFTLTGGTPSGGFYFGNGVLDSTFNPQLASIGSNTIGYSLSNKGCSDTAFATIQVISSPNPTINGQMQICANTSGVSYSASSTGLIYNWQVSGGTIASGLGTRTINVDWGSQGDGIITLNETNSDSCTTILIDTVDIDGQQIIGKISGDSAVCINSIDYPYSIGAASIFYNWTVSGGIIKGGQGTSSIDVEWNSLGQGTLSVRLFNTCGKDSTFYDTVQVSPTPNTSFTGLSNLCENEANKLYIADSIGLQYSWELTDGGFIASGQSNDSVYVDWNKAGNFDLKLIETNAFGCSDSSLQLVTVDSVSITNLSAIICANSSYFFDDSTLTNSGIYYEDLNNSKGCDSLVILNLIVLPEEIDSIYVSICNNDSFNFGGNTLNTSGNYVDTMVTTNGCDSIVYLNLVVLPTKTTSINDTICDGYSYLFGGQSLTTSGVYVDSLITSEGCDSVVQLSLTVKPLSQVNLAQSICFGDSILFAGNLLTNSGIYLDTLLGSNACDSITELNLTVAPKIDTLLNETICTGDSFSFYGQQLTASGNYLDTLVASSGCDSIVTLSLTVLSNTRDTIQQTICNGDSYLFGGQATNLAGTFHDTLIKQNSCDSILTLQLAVIPSKDTNFSITICEGSSYTFGSRQLLLAGNYSDTLTAVNGCDSIINLTLSILYSSRDTIQQSICNGDSYIFGGQTITVSGYYSDTLMGQNSCDSIISLNLTVLPIIRDSSSATICFGDTFLFASKKLSLSGTYSDTSLSSLNCDSISTLLLSVGPTISDSITVKSDTLIAFQTGVSYQWMTCDTSNGSLTAISGATNKYFVTNDSNYYAVELTSLSCTDTSTCYQRDLLTNIAKQGDKASKIVVFPNPTNGTVYITTEKMLNKNTRIQLRDINGRTIYNSLLNESVLNFKLDLSPFSKGLYFLEIKNNELMKTLKVVKQ